MKFTMNALLLVSSLIVVVAVVVDSANAVSLRAATERTTERTNNKNNNNKNHRKLIDFVQQAQAEKQADMIAGLEENAGDPETVDIIDTAIEEEDAEDTLEEEAEDIELSNEIQNGTSYEEEQTLDRRRFVRYEPSPWEQQWVDEIDDIMEDKSVCRNLMGTDAQKQKLHDFMEVICTASVRDPNVENNQEWCYYHDQKHFMWYNVDNRDEFEIYVDITPEVLVGVDPPQVMPVMLVDDFWAPIVSRMVYFDEFADEEYVEYIEPLVGTLRFPLAECIADQPLLNDVASFVIPPPSLERMDGRKILYDVGSSDWSRMQYVVEEWAAHGIEFTDILSCAVNRNEAGDIFPGTVPAEHVEHIYREYLPLVTEPTEDEGQIFLPTKIEEMAKLNDYVVVKLDRTDAKLKEAIVQYIANSPTASTTTSDPLLPSIHVNELIWEIDSSDNFLFQKYFDAQLQFDELSSMPLADTYRMLQSLRQKGIRAHAWI